MKVTSVAVVGSDYSRDCEKRETLFRSAIDRDLKTEETGALYVARICAPRFPR